MVALQHQRILASFRYFHARACRTIDRDIPLNFNAVVDHAQELCVLDFPSACIEPRRAKPNMK